MASVVIPGTSESRRARSLRTRSATPIAGILVLVILAFVTWKVLDLASLSDRAHRAQLGFAAIDRELAVHHGLEYEVAAEGLGSEVAEELRTSRNAIDASVVELSSIGIEGSEWSHLVAELDRLSAALNRQFSLMAAGDLAGAARVDHEETDPAFTHLTRDLRQLSEAEAALSRQARTGLRTGTVLGLGGAGAGIVALLCLLAYFTRRAAERQAKLLDERRQSQKLEAVGQLAGGVAHDFNNLLTAILGYCELARGRLDEDSDPDLRDDIEQITRSGERAAGLTRQLLAVSRRQTLQTTIFDLNGAVSGTQSLLERLLGTHITIETSLAPTECLIHADHGQIEQVIINLALNSRDAMPGGGVLRIETQELVLAAAEARSRFQAPAGEYVLLTIADDGCGMDKATRERAFEPFFTTKGLGEGTGLGLATVFGIVSQSDGYLALRSVRGAGTIFELLLRRATDPATAAKAEVPRVKGGGSERILLIEDESVVRNLTRSLLAREGYEVVVAADGERALELAREQVFDLVITDVVMPKLSGKVVAERLLRGQPNLPVIFISGYAHEVLGEGLGAGAAFLQKPFSVQELSAAVRRSLDGSPAPSSTATAASF